jgi:hypothetical protein
VGVRKWKIGPDHLRGTLKKLSHVFLDNMRSMILLYCPFIVRLSSMSSSTTCLSCDVRSRHYFLSPHNKVRLSYIVYTCRRRRHVYYVILNLDTIFNPFIICLSSMSSSTTCLSCDVKCRHYFLSSHYKVRLSYISFIHVVVNDMFII